MKENFISYKGWKIEPVRAGFSLWGKSPYYPIDTLWVTTKTLSECKRWADRYLRTFKVKKWPTLFPDFIAKETLTWPR